MEKNDIRFYQYDNVEIVEGKGMPTFPYHTHDSYIVGVIRSGEVQITIGNNNYTLKEGSIYVVPSGTGHSISPVSIYSYLTICIKGEYIKMMGDYSGIILTESDKVLHLCNEVFMSKDVDKFIASLSIILNEYLLSQKMNTKSKEPLMVSDIKYYINMHFKDRIILDDISKGIHVSKYHLVRTFRKGTGITPMQYLLLCRLRYAKRAILDGEAMKDVAYDLNFSAQSHLCTIFKKYMGISIGDYKNSVIKQ